MTIGANAPMTVLDQDECWSRLATAGVGRLALVVEDLPEIFPVNFVVDGDTLVFRTAEGTKLAGITVSPAVALEIDGEDAVTGEVWSVVAKGEAHRLEKFRDIYAAQELPVWPWHAGPKPVYVRISHLRVSGRRFLPVRGPRDEG